MSTLPFENSKSGNAGGLLGFLLSPEARGLAAGLLQGSAPSMTQPSSFGGALGFGLQKANDFGEADRKRKLAEAIFGLDTQKLGLDKGRFGLEKEELELKRRKHQIEIEQTKRLLDLIDQYESKKTEGGAPAPVKTALEGEVIKDVLDFDNENKSSQPVVEEETIVVTHPELNNGQPTKVKTNLNGRPLSEKEAIDVAIAEQLRDQAIEKGTGTEAPITSTAGILNKEAASTTPEAGGLLGAENSDAKRRAMLARGLLAAGDKAGAIKALYGKDSENTLTGLPREYQSLKELEKIDPEAAKIAREELDLRRQATKASITTKEQINKLRRWNALTADQKENVLAQGRSLGLSDQELLERYSNGETNYDIARELGMPEDEAKHLDKNFAPTGATRTAIQSTEGALAEEKWIAPKITAAMKPYSRKIFGKSPAFIKDAFSTDPKVQKQVAQALAARALQPEIAGFRSRAAGGSNAHGALQELTDKSLNELHVWETQVAPEVYEMAQNILSEWIHGMGEARVQAMKGVRPSAAKEESSEMVTIRNPKTGETRRVTRKEAEELTRGK